MVDSAFSCQSKLVLQVLEIFLREEERITELEDRRLRFLKNSAKPLDGNIEIACAGTGRHKGKYMQVLEVIPRRCRRFHRVSVLIYLGF